MKLFTEHPRSVGETYLEHFLFATRFGIHMLIGGVACILHAIFPFVFQKTGSNILLKMMYHFIERMPQVEERILVLQESIERKRHEQ